MRILGIDPGSLHTGFGVVEKNVNTLKVVDCGCITSLSKDNFEKRYSKIFAKLQQVILETKPDAVVLENVIFCNNSKVAIKLGEARGVSIVAAVLLGLPIKEFSPKKIKQAVVGNGNASKEQVQNMVQRILKLPELPQADTADALAAAICCIHEADNPLSQFYKGKP